MKTRFKALTAILLVVLVLSPISVAIRAQEAPDTTQNSNAFFYGARNAEGVTTGVLGVGKNLIGHLWAFSINNYGTRITIAAELAFLFTAGPFAFGPIAGPNFDSVPVETELDPVTYILGAVGAIGSVRISEKSGLWVYYKEIYSDETQDEYKIDHSFGGGFYILFGS